MNRSTPPPLPRHKQSHFCHCHCGVQDQGPGAPLPNLTRSTKQVKDYHVRFLPGQLPGSCYAAAVMHQLDGALQGALLLEFSVYQPLQLLGRGALQGEDGWGRQVARRQILSLHVCGFRQKAKATVMGQGCAYVCLMEDRPGKECFARAAKNLREDRP